MRGLSDDMLKAACLLYIKHNKSQYDMEANSSADLDAERGSYNSLTFHDEWPLTDYASHYLLLHADAAQSQSVSQKKFLETFTDSHELKAWRRANSIRLSGDRIESQLFHPLNPVPCDQDLPLPHILVAQILPHLVQCLFKTHIDINTVCPCCGSALHLACAYGNVMITKILLEQGADANVTYGNSVSPFAMVLNSEIRPSDADIFKLLLRYGASVSPLDLTRAMARATRLKSPRLLRLLVEKGGDPNFIEYSEGTPIYLEEKENDIEAVVRLLERGADLSTPHDRYGTALPAAAALGDEKLIEVFLRAGANVNLQHGKYGSALQAAVVFGHENLVKKLLQAGADVNLQGGKYGSALGAAVHHYEYFIEKVLLDHGAKLPTLESKQKPSMSSGVSPQHYSRSPHRHTERHESDRDNG